MEDFINRVNKIYPWKIYSLKNLKKNKKNI